MKPKAYKIYMDACCFCRPFDSRDQERVRNEAIAVLDIIEEMIKNGWTIFASDALDHELFIPFYPYKPEISKFYTTSTTQYLITTPTTLTRANILQKTGMKRLDSYHVALAESCGADILLSVDGRLLAQSKRLALKLQTANPIDWLKEVLPK